MGGRGCHSRHYVRVLDAGSPEDYPDSLKGPEGDSESFTSQRIELLGWLDTHAPALTPLYRGTLFLAMRDSFPGRAHFVAHAIREVRNRLPGALGSKVARQDAGYEHLADKIHKRWVEEGLPEDGRLRSPEGSVPSASGPERREVSYGFLASVGRLLEEHAVARANRAARERAGFGALDEYGASPQYVVKNWNRLFRDAEGFAHARNNPLPEEADGEWVEKFFEFEMILMTLSKRSYENLDDLDNLLKRVNTR